VRVRITSRVEPIASPMLAPPRRAQALLHQLVISVGGAVFHKGFDQVRFGREAGQIKREAAREGATVRFGGWLQTFALQLGQNEGIDRIPNREPRTFSFQQRRIRSAWSLRFQVSPMPLPERAGKNPLPE